MQLMVEEKRQIPPSWWLDASAKLNVLIGDEHETLFNLQSSLAKMKATFIGEGKNVSEATVLVEAEDDYRDMQIQRGKIKQIEEFIRIAKKFASMKEEEFMNS